jgi:gamma-glutamyltranspeptidase/glutathione hydrolase
MRGVVVCPQPPAAEAGALMLEQGGNAFDAAISAALVQMVTDPHMCGLGGFGCATISHAGLVEHVGFHGRIGSRATPSMWSGEMIGRLEMGGYPLFADHRSNLGHRSVTTPGTVAGLRHLHRHARLAWPQLVEPAVDLARSGFPTPDYLVDMAARLAVPGMPTSLERMAHTTDSARLWCRPDGSLKRPGDEWRNPDFADTLERLARVGLDDFYRGEVASAIAAEIERGDGYVTLSDLADYRVRIAPPVRSRFRGFEVCTSVPPGGGVTVAQALNVLDRLPKLDVAMLAGTLHEAMAERIASVGDPEFVEVPLDRLLSAEWAHEAAARVLARQRAVATPALSTAGTTHLSTYDADGNAVALTHTLGVYSGVIVPGTGVALNSAMDSVDPEPGRPSSVAPGKARASGMSPTLVLRDGRVRMVVGSPGTNAIMTAVAQVIANVVARGMSPHEAVAAPRVHNEGGPLFVEGRISRRDREMLESAGFDVRPTTGNYVPSFGRVQLIVVDDEGRFIGASDPRRDGGVAAYSER